MSSFYHVYVLALQEIVRYRGLSKGRFTPADLQAQADRILSGRNRTYEDHIV